MKVSLFFLLAVLNAGCADVILSREENKAFSKDAKVMRPHSARNLSEAAMVANKLSTAYFTAARQAQNTQDAASAIVILTAASAVAGAVKGTSDTAIANRALGAIGVQQVASRGVSKATIESLYDGAQTLNCIGAVATIYQNDKKLNLDTKAALITVAVIREVRINARRGLTREVADYSSVVDAFAAVIKDDDSGATVLKRNQIQPSSVPTPTELETYLARLGGCVTAKRASQSADKDGNPSQGSDNDKQ